MAKRREEGKQVGGKAKRWEEIRRERGKCEEVGKKAKRWQERQKGTTYEAICVCCAEEERRREADRIEHPT